MSFVSSSFFLLLLLLLLLWVSSLSLAEEQEEEASSQPQAMDAFDVEEEEQVMMMEEQLEQEEEEEEEEAMQEETEWFQSLHTYDDGMFRSDKDVTAVWKFALGVWFFSWLIFLGVVQAMVGPNPDDRQALRLAYQWGIAIPTLLAQWHLVFVGYTFFFHNNDNEKETTLTPPIHRVQGNGNLSLQLGAPFVGMQVFGMSAMLLLVGDVKDKSWHVLVLTRVLTTTCAFLSSTTIYGFRHFLPFLLGVTQVSEMLWQVLMLDLAWLLDSPSVLLALEWSAVACRLWTHVWLWWQQVWEWKALAESMKNSCPTTSCTHAWWALIMTIGLLTLLEWYQTLVLVYKVVIVKFVFHNEETTTTMTHKEDDKDNDDKNDKETTTSTTTTTTTTTTTRDNRRSQKTRQKKDN